MNAPTKPPIEGNVAAVLAQAAAATRARRRRWRIAWLVVLAIVAAVGWNWWANRSAGGFVYETAAVVRGDLTVSVTATGSLSPTNQVEVSSELSGTVRQVLADYNGVVRKGDVLAELDTDRLKMSVEGARAKLAAANAGVEEAKATIAEAKGELDRKTTLVARNVASDQELQSAKASYARAVAGAASAAAAVQVAAADLALAETNLAKACICSPIDGVVLSRAVEPGQTVAASLQAPVLFTIAEDLKRMELRVDVDEADVGRVADGQVASFTVDAHPGRSFPATIRSVRYASETTQGVVTYKAILAVDNADLALRPGMTATADIVVETVRDGLLAPAQALRWVPPAAASEERGFLSRLIPRPPAPRTTVESDGTAVYVLADGVPTAVPVSIVATDGLKTAVTGDLNPGAAVIVDSTAVK